MCEGMHISPRAMLRYSRNFIEIYATEIDRKRSLTALARKLRILLRDYAFASFSVRRVNAEFAGRKITQVDRAESRP